jgi:hypothetical protein
MDPKALGIVIPVLAVLPVLYLRLRRMMKPQRLKLRSLWVQPAIMIFAAALLTTAAKPPPSIWGWFVAAALPGAVGGWYWGKLTQLHLHPGDRTVMSTGSQAGMIVLVLLMVLRLGMRAGVKAQMLQASAGLLTDAFIVFAALLFAARGLEIFLRARSLMAKNGTGAA